MKIPYYIPVRFDEENETIDDKKGNVLMICNWPNSGLDKQDVKDRALHTVKLINGEVMHKKTTEYFDAVALSEVVEAVDTVSDKSVSETVSLPLKKKLGRPKGS